VKSDPDAVPSNCCFTGCEDIDKTLTLMAETAAKPCDRRMTRPYGRLAQLGDPPAVFNLSSLCD
jgi:hypothetical protein